MNFREAFILAINGIMANRFRSFLTMLGMIVGVASIIIVLSVGGGANSAIMAHYARIGSNNITVSSGSLRFPITPDLIEEIMAGSPSLIGRFTTMGFAEELVLGQPAYNIVGAMPEQVILQDWPVSIGTFITQDQVQHRRKVVVLGAGLANELYGDYMPIGEYLRIRGLLFEVVGVMSEFGALVGGNQDMRAYIPYSTLMRMTNSQSAAVTFVASDPSVCRQAVTEIQSVIRGKYGTDVDGPNVIRYSLILDSVEHNDTLSSNITMLLFVVAGVSLLVGGIGIMNIMLVSVLERTREIGIRRALGATYRMLMSQFLLEAMIVSLVGGSLGGGIGMLIATLYALYMGWGNIISLPSVVLGFTFSVAVGLFFGIYPASQAAKMDPIQALRGQ